MPYFRDPAVMLSLPLRSASANNSETRANADADAGGITDGHATAQATDDAGKGGGSDVDMWDIEARQIAQLRDERSSRLQAKNRRKRYLEVHPEYFDDASLELADPLLYDRLIRRFQTAAERERDGQKKDFADRVTANLWRPMTYSPSDYNREALHRPRPDYLSPHTRGTGRQIREEDEDEVPMSKEEGKAWWRDEMTQRFLRGDDNDFEYKKVDGNIRYDDPEEERDILEAYFDSMDSDYDTDGEGKEKILTGETGIQDF
jgi:hypothetical protein